MLAQRIGVLARVRPLRAGGSVRTPGGHRIPTRKPVGWDGGPLEWTHAMSSSSRLFVPSRRQFLRLLGLAGVFALDLCAMTVDTDWAALELPDTLSVRVGLHAGPLFDFSDRVTGQLTLAGKHVTRAARVEPVTPPGMVYATQEFAALAAAYGVTEFVCDPVGRIRLAKKAGMIPLFAVRADPRVSAREESPSRRHTII